ncbi:MAG: hypothetical protein IKX37_05700 [Bacteroidales bacterium]|nr:hypothetical protein [Bacteroidales bacterium]
MINIYTLTSPLHDKERIKSISDEFLGKVFPQGGFNFHESDFSTYGQDGLDLIFVRTGGAEGLFLQVVPELFKRGARHFLLLTSGGNNSLAASMEILSFLGKVGLSGEILHGSPEYIRGRIDTLRQIAEARKRLDGLRLGVLGAPSDWLIASDVDPEAIQEGLGISLVEVPMREVKDAIAKASPIQVPLPAEAIESASGPVKKAIPGAEQIYGGLLAVVKGRRLDGFTLRCFDLLGDVGNTGCLALAQFNADGIPAGCEGDIPALLSMTVAQVATGHTGFMANPSRINPETGEIVFAHCTIPLDIVDKVALDTHFESGIGIGIRGHYPEQDVTILKLSGDLSQAFVAEGRIVRNLSEPDLCRSQIVLQLDEPALAREYFLRKPIGNHHIIVPGRWKALLTELLPQGHHCCGGGHGHGGGGHHHGGGCCGGHHH